MPSHDEEDKAKPHSLDKRLRLTTVRCLWPVLHGLQPSPQKSCAHRAGRSQSGC